MPRKRRSDPVIAVLFAIASILLLVSWSMTAYPDGAWLKSLSAPFEPPPTVLATSVPTPGQPSAALARLSPTPRASLTPTPGATPRPAQNQPVGFPVAQTVRPWQVLDTAQGKILAPPSADGPTVVKVARNYQSRQVNDATANRYGWNCRVHIRHEGAPGVDWYLPTGTPVIATMRGRAELYFVTTTNAYEYYGVDPRVTLGLPAPTAPRYPLPGNGGGMGVFVSVVNGNLRAEAGHLDPDLTLTVVPDNAFIAPYSRQFDFRRRFAPLLAPSQFTLVASWPVLEGDVIGFVGNTGYSDVSHLHYHILTRDRKTFYCPTREPLPGSGWLFGPPENFR